MHKYMNEKRREGRSISHLAMILTAYLKTTEEYPALTGLLLIKKYTSTRMLPCLW
jgi:hypothetical protein